MDEIIKKRDNRACHGPSELRTAHFLTLADIQDWTPERFPQNKNNRATIPLQTVHMTVNPESEFADTTDTSYPHCPSQNCVIFSVKF